MKKSSVSILAGLLVLIACKTGNKEMPKLNIFSSSLEQLLTYKQPIDLYVFKFGRFKLESHSTLRVRKNDITKEFSGFSTVEMDKRGNFKLTRKVFFEPLPTEVIVVGSEAMYRDDPKKEFKKLFPDPEFLNWARAAVTEIFSTYDQTDFADSAQLTDDGASNAKCYKNASGNLCLNSENSLPMSGKYRVDVSGGKTTDESTTMDLDFKITPHPQESELIVF